MEEAEIPGTTPSYDGVFPYRPKGLDTEFLCVVYLPTYDLHDVKARMLTADAITEVISRTCGVRPYEAIPPDMTHLPKSMLGKISRALHSRVERISSSQTSTIRPSKRTESRDERRLLANPDRRAGLIAIGDFERVQARMRFDMRVRESIINLPLSEFNRACFRQIPLGLQLLPIVKVLA